MDARVLALLVTPAQMRRLRVLCRDRPEYGSLVAISAVLLAASPERLKVALSRPGRHAEPMTSREFAERAGITARSVQRACAAGRLTAVKRSGIWLIDPLELARRTMEAERWA